MAVVVVVSRVDIVSSISAKVVQRLAVVIRINSNEIASRPHFNSDQHNVDALWMIELKQSINQSIKLTFYSAPKVDQRAGQLSLLHLGITKQEKNRIKT